MAKSTQKQQIAEIPDHLRRRELQDAPSVTPDEERTVSGAPTEDGGVDQHPIHDSDIEDAEPDDFEEMIEAASDGGFDPTDKYEVEREAGLDRKVAGT